MTQTQTMLDFSKKQLQILAFPKSNYDALICDGAIRAGKTSIMSVAFVLWAMQNFNGRNFGICSKTIRTAERNIVRPLISMTYIRKRYNIRYKSGEFLEISNGRHSNTFYIFGGKDASSYQLIQGITLAGVLLDEVALMPRSFVEQALARCSVAGRKFWFNCNPEGQLHWFYQEWIKEPERHNALHLHFTLDDNPSLDQSIKDSYRSMYAGVFYQRYIEGMWVSAEGVIYADMFSEDNNVLSVDQIKALEFEGEYYVTSDFGIQNATVFLLWRKIKNEQKYVCLREYYYSGREERRQKTVKELVDDLLEMLGGIYPKSIIVDPSASALKVELRQRKLRVQDADNEVLNGIAHTGKLLQDARLLFSEECENVIDEFSLYMWDEAAAERGEDIPIKENDHCLVGETEIETLFGKRKIKDLVGKIGFVWSYKNGRKVLRPFFKVRQTQKDQKILRILTENGKQICCTPEHRILTERGWVRAKDLTPKDRIVDVMD